MNQLGIRTKHLRKVASYCGVLNRKNLSLFGSATAVFKNRLIHSLNRNRSTNGYITAASTQEGQEFDMFFSTVN